ncbi:hypothetical protein NIES4074_05470 [Cylindrospermum sp. NIES-4074]|nr:hypothetical protein NIES4074_05470 [Cylindrospermum sp. NIES-4074]
MKAQILMLGVFFTYMSIALPECKAQSLISQTNIQKQLQQAMTKQSGEPSVEIKFVDMIFGKPPKAQLLMDVTLHNHYDQPCWFLLPHDINSLAIGQGGVNRVEAFEFRGKGRVVVGRFLGTPDLRAFLLPAGAKLKIRRLPIELWEEKTVDQVQIEVVVASQLTINGEPGAVWFGTNPMSDIEADVTVDESDRIGLREMPNFDEVPISLVEKERFKLVVPL